jgi:hypothetical protein
MDNRRLWQRQRDAQAAAEQPARAEQGVPPPLTREQIARDLARYGHDPSVNGTPIPSGSATAPRRIASNSARQSTVWRGPARLPTSGFRTRTKVATVRAMSGSDAPALPPAMPPLDDIQQQMAACVTQRHWASAHEQRTAC